MPQSLAGYSPRMKRLLRLSKPELAREYLRLEARLLDLDARSKGATDLCRELAQQLELHTREALNAEERRAANVAARVALSVVGNA